MFLLLKCVVFGLFWENVECRPEFMLTHPSCDLFQPTVTEDFGHLPPEQRRKRLQQKFEEICKELQKEVDKRCVR